MRSQGEIAGFVRLVWEQNYLDVVQIMEEIGIDVEEEIQATARMAAEDLEVEIRSGLSPDGAWEKVRQYLEKGPDFKKLD